MAQGGNSDLSLRHDSFRVFAAKQISRELTAGEIRDVVSNALQDIPKPPERSPHGRGASRSDPYERADEDATMFYGKWMCDRAFLLIPAQGLVGQFPKTLEGFPPRQKPASFSSSSETPRTTNPRLA
jgi:hypothetical protein